jgi:hypothetical protein
MKIKAIITGATGMVGEGVLHECLLHPDVESVLVINRKPCGIKHKKLKEIIHKNFFDLSSVENELKDYNVCYFCAGTSSVGLKEEEFRKITYDLTLSFANALLKINSVSEFCYVSGAATDSTEKGNIMWARVKGKTENNLLKFPFKAVYMFRPGYIQPIKGLKNTKGFYKILAPLYPLFKVLFPKHMVKLEQLGKAMIHSTLLGFDKKILECVDIVKLSKT